VVKVRGNEYSNYGENPFSHTKPSLPLICHAHLSWLLGVYMKILGKITEPAPKAESAAYQCWMCGIGHESPGEYLRHINSCKPEAISVQTL
jgi:hypothetical protein